MPRARLAAILARWPMICVLRACLAAIVAHWLLEAWTMAMATCGKPSPMGRCPVPTTILPMASTTVLVGLWSLVLLLLFLRSLLPAMGTRFLAFSPLWPLLACNLCRPSALLGDAADLFSSWARPGSGIIATLDVCWSWPPRSALDAGKLSRAPCYWTLWFHLVEHSALL